MEYKERFINALLTLADTSRGTLWRVAEPVWVRNVPHYVDTGRKLHVGLSVRKRNCIGITDMIPMLIGTSRPMVGAFTATRCFGPKSKRTTFFRLRPYQIPVFEAYDEERGKMIAPNPHKPRLDPDELQRLNELLNRKGNF